MKDDGQELDVVPRVGEQEARAKLSDVVQLRAAVRIQRPVAVEAECGFDASAKNALADVVVDAEVGLELVVSLSR